MVVYRFAQWHPDLVSHLFSVCTPFMPPSDQYMSTADLVNGPLPQFGYQLHLAGPEVEAKLNSSERIKQFMKGMYGGRTDDGKVVFSPEKGINFDVIDRIGAPPLLNNEVSIPIGLATDYAHAQKRKSITTPPSTRAVACMVLVNFCLPCKVTRVDAT